MDQPQAELNGNSCYIFARNGVYQFVFSDVSLYRLLEGLFANDSEKSELKPGSAFMASFSIEGHQVVIEDGIVCGNGSLNAVFRGREGVILMAQRAQRRLEEILLKAQASHDRRMLAKQFARITRNDQESFTREQCYEGLFLGYMLRKAQLAEIVGGEGLREHLAAFDYWEPKWLQFLKKKSKKNSRKAK